jgi:tRNA (guanine-N7-)-methyltransferase
MDPDLSRCVRPEFGAILASRKLDLEAYLQRFLPPAGTFLWEVGCGHGHFLTAYAAAHRERTCIGVDLVGERIARAMRKRDRAALANLHFVRAEARLFLEALPARPCISDVFMLFPDPWPKSRHHKHRVLQPGFLDALAARATDDCRLYFRTDHQPYFDEARTTIARSSCWDLVEVDWPFEFETVFQSRAVHHESLIARRKTAGS